MSKTCPMKKQLFQVILLAVYIMIILSVTVLHRKVLFQRQVEITPFWSYREWITGKNDTGLQIILNIGLFVPFGYIITCYFRKYNVKKIAVVLLGLFFSVIIEFIQYYFRVGLAELDDIFNNTIGTIIGSIFGEICYKYVKKYVDLLVVFFVVIGIIFSCFEIKHTMGNKNNIAQFAFDIEKIDNGFIHGYAFPYDIDAGKINFSIVLREVNSGNSTKLDTTSNIKREDINAYFCCNYDYAYSGFYAKLDCNYEVAEVLIDWKNIGIRETGMYIVNGKVQYNNDINNVFMGTDLYYILDEGRLIAKSTSLGYQLYQVGDKMYWIMDNNYCFETNGKTFIQYQLWTTNTSKLPEKRQGSEFDYIGFFFEDNEITSEINCGEYRVAVRKLPKEYPIKYIVSGFYKNGNWIWKELFRCSINRFL